MSRRRFVERLLAVFWPSTKCNGWTKSKKTVFVICTALIMITGVIEISFSLAVIFIVRLFALKQLQICGAFDGSPHLVTDRTCSACSTKPGVPKRHICQCGNVCQTSLISARRILFMTNSRHSTSNELRLIMKLTDYKFQIYSRFITNGIWQSKVLKRSKRNHSYTSVVGIAWVWIYFRVLLYGTWNECSTAAKRVNGSLLLC